MTPTPETLRKALFDPANGYCRFCGHPEAEGHEEDCVGVAFADAWEADLRGDTDEWLCEVCNVVYMRKSLTGGPTNLVCPNGHGGCLPHETAKMLRLRQRLEEAEAKVLTLEVRLTEALRDSLPRLAGG